MLTNLIEAGNRLELYAIAHSQEEKAKDTAKHYNSKVQAILSEDRLEITMPIEQMKLVLLPLDAQYEMVAYTGQGMYQCFVQVKDRYKSNNVYLLVVELLTDWRKYQRREYYRFSCALEIGTRLLEEEELEAVEQRRAGPGYDEKELKQGVIVDISGGGIRFLSEEKYESGKLLLCNFQLLKGGVYKDYNVAAKVLKAMPAENKQGMYEHRVQYYQMSEDVREDIIRFIFEEERRIRKNLMNS